MSWHQPAWPAQKDLLFQSGNSDGYDILDGVPFYLSLEFAIPLLADPVTTAPTATALGIPNEYFACTIRRVFIAIVVAGATGTTEQGTLAVLVNNTTATNVITTLQWTALLQQFDSGDIAVPLPAGCFWTLRVTPPTFVTNPQDTHHACRVVVTYP